MSLYLQIGAYTTPTCTVRCTGRVLRPIEYNTFIIAHEHEVSFEGYLYADGPGNLSTAMNALDAAIKVPNATISLVSTVTGATSHTIIGSGSIGGIVVKDFKYMDTQLHMATQVKFGFTASVIYSNTAEARTVVSLTESIRIQGDGEADIVLAPQAGLKSIYQQVGDYSDIMVTQSGKVVSRSSFVALPSPVIVTPGAKVSRQTSVVKTYKQRGTAIWLYEQDYSYTFQLNEMPVSPIIPSYLV